MTTQGQSNGAAFPNQTRCSPLCGASRAYGRFDAWWKHELECPVRKAVTKNG